MTAAAVSSPSVQPAAEPSGSPPGEAGHRQGPQAQVPHHGAPADVGAADPAEAVALGAAAGAQRHDDGDAERAQQGDGEDQADGRSLRKEEQRRDG